MKRSTALVVIIALVFTLGVLKQISCEETQEWYFWNEVTGETQWEDPGDVPYEDETTGKRFWLDENGARLDADPKAHQYKWIESWSAEHGRPYFFNQKTQESTWDRPADLGWRRVKAQKQRDEL